MGCRNRLMIALCVSGLVVALASPATAGDRPSQPPTEPQADEEWEQRYEQVEEPRTDYSYRVRFSQQTHRTAISPYRQIRDHRGYFHVAPLLGVPGLFGDVTVDGETTSLDAGFTESLQNINLTAGAAFEVGYRNVGLVGDFRHFDGTIDNGADSFELQKFVTNVAMNWNYGVLPVLELGPVAGLRHYWAQAGGAAEEDNNQDAELQTGHWLDPIVGLQGRFSFADIVYVPFYGDVGGIGYGSEITWQGYAGVGVSLNNTDIELGYRALYSDFEGDELDYDLLQAGPTLKTRFRF